MSATLIRDPVPLSPVEKRDIRSKAVASKRDKNHREKWSYGISPGSGVRLNWNFDALGDAPELMGGNQQHLARIRPTKQWSQMSHGTEKSRANKNPKPNGNYETSRLSHKASANMESNDSTLSRSLLDLLPTHVDSTDTSVMTALARSAPDSEILYSFDTKGPSPGSRANPVGLDSLVERAEKKWVAEQTDKIVEGEYEVLDADGEIVTRSSKKSKRSPKAVAQIVKHIDVEDDDGFELV